LRLAPSRRGAELFDSAMNLRRIETVPWVMQWDMRRMLHLDTGASLRAEAAELTRIAEEEVRHPATASHLRTLACECLALAHAIEGRRERDVDRDVNKARLAGATMAHLAGSADRHRGQDA